MFGRVIDANKEILPLENIESKKWMAGGRR
jgi:hypothetical protein